MATAFKHMQPGAWQRGAQCFAMLQDPAGEFFESLPGPLSGRAFVR
jgi:hypothetical protein